MNARQQRLLIRLLSQPTAPFREQHIMAIAHTVLDRARIPHFYDPAGNLVVGCDSAATYRQRLRDKQREPLRLFIAHTDHPGFHGSRWISPDRLAVKWHGGSPVKHLRGSRVWLATHAGRVGDGRIARATLLPSRHAIDHAEIRLQQPLPQLLPADSLFGGFRFRAPVWQNGKRLYTHAADDLVGVFAVLTTALRLYTGRSRPASAFLGLLTRGEEVGFTGALAHLELGWLQRARRPLVVISLETSRTLPNAVLGQGPVVRLGDRRTVFDPAYLHVLSQVAEHCLPGRHQRRVMDGGTCEATAAIAHGLRAIGLSVPLGNYHNQGFEGGADCIAPEGPAPEFVHLNDVAGLVKLCLGLMQPGLPWADPWKQQRQRLHANLQKYKNQFRESSGRDKKTRHGRRKTR